MLDGLATALAATKLDFAFSAWSHAPSGDYGVYSLSGQKALSSDSNAGSEKMLEGFIDYFCRSDALTAKNAIESALSGLGLYWELNSVQYEDDTGYLHYEWIWRDTNGTA